MWGESEVKEMGEYIEKDAVIKKIAEEQEKAATGIEDVTYYRAIKIIRSEPATDVQLIRRGRWKLTNNPSFRKCSECGAWWSSDIADNYFTNYCPKCGARMDGDQNDD